MERIRSITNSFMTTKSTYPGHSEAESMPIGSVPKDTTYLHDVLNFKLPDLATIGQLIKQATSGKPLDDRKLLLEHLVTMMQKLPPNSAVGHKMESAFITLLWNDLPHPPATFVSPQFRYHQADGSFNNPAYPMLGAAGQPYARSVPALKPKNPYLPDPELVFDQLLRRRDFVPQKAGLNRFLFSFATVIIHDLFQSNYEKPWINNTSSYFDLSVVYGNNQEEQDRVRTFISGRIFPDTIASSRLMMMAPGPIVIAILFSRHHNYIAERLFEINESGKYKSWDDCSEGEKTWQDNDIFQLSRNINSAFFVKCVLTDYVSTILNTLRVDSEWHLEIGEVIKQQTEVERGRGNAVACEFNMVYHWHAALSAADENWMTKEFNESYPGVDPEDLTKTQFKMMMVTKIKQLEAKHPNQWTFGGMERNEDGTFDDEQLGELIKDCIEEPARAFGARATPAGLKVVEVMAQEQARNVFHCATMNEFRASLNLQTFKSFEEWNPDKEVANAAEKLYGHIDHLELYPGLMAEETKPNMTGSGLQPGHTIGRGILADAVALVRGDRFFTHDLNASTLTSWGMAQLQPAPGAYGGFLANILARGLPAAWGEGYSTYNLLPFHTPVAIRQILQENGKLPLYNTLRPPPSSKLHGLHSWQACVDAFDNPSLFAVQYLDRVNMVTDNAGFHLAWDDPNIHDPAKRVIMKGWLQPQFEKQVSEYFTSLTQSQIQRCSIKYEKPANRRQLNVVRDIFNVVPVHWNADKYGIPLRTEESPLGLVSVAELQLAMVMLFVFSSFNASLNGAWALRSAAEQIAPKLRRILELRFLMTSGRTEIFADLFARCVGSYTLSEPAKHLYRTLHEHRIPKNKAVGELLGTLLPTGGNITQQPSLILDLVLSPAYAYAKDRMTELAKRDDEQARLEFEGWVLEAMRVRPTVPGLLRTVKRDVTIEDGEGRIVAMKEGDRVILATSSAHMDPVQFPNPTTLDPFRPRTSYIHMGHGMHVCTGTRLVLPAICAMLRQIFLLHNLRRAEGTPGTLVAVSNHLGHAKDACVIRSFLDQNCLESPFPTSMMIEYDALDE